MAPQMAASALRSSGPSTFLVFLVFLIYFMQPLTASRITYSREALLNIEHSSPGNFPTVFTDSESFAEILLGGAAALHRLFRKRRRGKRAGALVRLRQRGSRTPLPSIHLANVRSLANKKDELLLLSTKNKDFNRSAALCFTETWLTENLPGFQLLRSDRVTELSGKTRGGGTCFYINEGWCTDVTVLNTLCSPHVECFFVNCRPFYSPREFASFVLVGVYIPPQACVTTVVACGEVHGW